MTNELLDDESGIKPGPGIIPGALKLRQYQLPIFQDHKSGIVVLHWSRQIGKSFTLAAWAVYRLLTRPGRLVTVLSNSRENGAEFLLKCSEICRLTGTRFATEVKCPDLEFEDFRMELRIENSHPHGRIKVLAANPRTARGFSGDLILDEFAFHENASAIWEAAEPILAANPDFLCRIASTGNGRHNLFYRIAGPATTARVPSDLKSEILNLKSPSDSTEPADAPIRPLRNEEGSHPAGENTASCENTAIDDASPSPGGEGRGEGGRPTVPLKTSTGFENPAQGWADSQRACPGSDPTPPFFLSPEGFKVSRVTRTMAHALGVPIYDPQSRQPVTPDEARSRALDKRAYDQNYECAFADESLTLLSHELITAAERDDVGHICEQDWTAAALVAMQQAVGPLYAGFDVGRKIDLSVITVIEKVSGLHLVRGILRMRDMRLPDQELRLGEICRLPKFKQAALDMTGLGLGLFEYAAKAYGSYRIRGINFAGTVPATRSIEIEGRKRETVRVTEALAIELLRVYEDRRLQHPRDGRLRDDLRKPEKITTPTGRVSIAATRDEAGHADHFWSLALAVDAAANAPAPFAYERIILTRRDPMLSNRRLLI